MSANIDLVRRICEPWERGDFSSVEWADPEIELVFVDGTSPGRWTGVDRIGPPWKEILSAWDDLRTFIDEYRELEGDRILALTRNTGRGKASGMELADVHPRGANLFQLRDGKVIKLTAWWDRDRALADLGL